MWEKVVVALARDGQAKNFKILTVTDTVCTINFTKWMIRFTLLAGFPYAVLLIPNLVKKCFQNEENFLKATTLSRNEIIKYSNIAGYSQAMVFANSILCLYILDVPVMSDEVLDFERSKEVNFVNFRKFIPSKSVWLWHLIFYHIIVISSVVNAISMTFLIKSLNNTVVDPELVYKARRLHGTTIKTILNTIILITGPLSIIFIWLSTFDVDYMFSAFAISEWTCLIATCNSGYFSVDGIAECSVAVVLPGVDGEVVYNKQGDSDGGEEESKKLNVPKHEFNSFYKSKT